MDARATNYNKDVLQARTSEDQSCATQSSKDCFCMSKSKFAMLYKKERKEKESD